MFARYGMRNLTTDDQPNIPLPSGGAGNGHIYARNRQFVLGSTWTPTDSRCSKCDSATRGRARTAGARQRQRAGSVRTWGCHRSAHRRRAPDTADHRILRSGTPGDEPAVAVPDGLQPEDQLHLDGGAHSLKSGYEFQHILTEVQDVNPLYGRDTYNGQFSRPASRRTTSITCRLHARAVSQYALSSVLVANLRRTCTSPTSRTTGASART